MDIPLVLVRADFWAPIEDRISSKLEKWNNFTSSRQVTSSEDSISDSSLDIFVTWGLGVARGGRGGSVNDGDGGAGMQGGRGGVGRGNRNGAGMFILFIKCSTYN